MKKLMASFIAVSIGVFACEQPQPTDVDGPAFGAGQGASGVSNTAFVYLFEKDPTDPTWPIVPGGAWGKLKYNAAGVEFEFNFNGHGLTPGDDYTLMYYPDPWPANGLICFGSAIANGGGNVHIAGSMELSTDLPIAGDNNNGAKIWLVWSSDLDCDPASGTSFTLWNPTEYLFENNLITYTDQ